MSVSQPALSVQIREMEATFGQPLVERRARDVVLTPFGRAILLHAERVIAAMDDMRATARLQTGQVAGLRLGLIPTVAPYLLPEALAAMREGGLADGLRITEAKTDRLLADLQDGRLDAAVLARPVPAEDVVAQPLFSDRFLLAGTAARLAALGATAPRPDGLSESQLMLLEDGHCLTDQALDICGRTRASGQVDMGTSSLATLLRLVAAGHGVTLVPELAARCEGQATPQLSLRRFAAPQPEREIVLVRRHGTGPSGWVSTLARILAAVGARLIAELQETPETRNGPPVEGGPV